MRKDMPSIEERIRRKEFAVNCHVSLPTLADMYQDKESYFKNCEIWEAADSQRMQKLKEAFEKEVKASERFPDAVCYHMWGIILKQRNHHSVDEENLLELWKLYVELVSLAWFTSEETERTTLKKHYK